MRGYTYCILIFLFAGLVGCAGMESKMPENAPYQKVILIGIDGTDPKVIDQLMEAGDLPNFLKLKQIGSYHRLRTSNPAESPVAWTSIATGMNPGTHNIFDFI